MLVSFLDHNLAMFLNMLFPDSQNWIVFQPNIIIDAKLGKYKILFLHNWQMWQAQKCYCVQWQG